MPPCVSRLIKARGEGGDREKTQGQGPLIHSRSVIMWSGLRETEIEIERRRQTKSSMREKTQQVL